MDFIKLISTLCAVIASSGAPQAVQAAQVIAVVTHDVKDVPVWKQHFDSALSIRRYAGELNAVIKSDPRHPNRIVVHMSWNNAESAYAWLTSDTLREAMHLSGVTGPATVSLNGTSFTIIP